MTFWKDLEFGKIYEQKAHALYNAPITVAPYKLFTPYDFITGNGLRVEVKADRLWQKTSNVFIEIESRQKPSGIAVSTARYWVFFLEVAKRKDQIFIGIPLDLLKKFVVGYPLKRGGDNYTSVGHVVPAKDLVDFYIQIKQFGEKK